MKNSMPKSSSGFLHLYLAFIRDQHIFPALEFMGCLKTEQVFGLKLKLCMCEKGKKSDLGHPQTFQAQLILRGDKASVLPLARDVAQDSITPCSLEVFGW